MSTALARPLERLQRALQALRANVGDLIPDADIDSNQAAANELAWAVARSEAAVATAEWAEVTGNQLAIDIAEAAIIDAYSAIVGRAAQDAIRDAAILERIQANYRPVEELGASDDQRLLRQTFRDFARREIRPRADQIHRENLDVPEEILRGLGELGAFGLSVPETYGGSQGDRGDFETMLIVTEELSRGS